MYERSGRRPRSATTTREPRSLGTHTLFWPIRAEIVTHVGTFVVSHVVGHDLHLALGAHR